MSIRILHLSDIHLDKNKMQETKDMLKKLLKSLKKCNQEKSIDFVFYTGDVVDKGGESFRNIEEGFDEFYKIGIENLGKELKIDTENFIIVPGNHDVLENDNTEKMEPYYIKKLNNSNDINDYVNKILQNPKEKEEIVKYKEFERKKYKENVNNYITNLHSCYIREVKNIKLGIVAFNTAWRCYTDSGVVMLGKKQIYDANEKVADCNVKIALMHQGPNELVECEIEEVSNLLMENYDILCCGHVHKGKNYIYDDMSNKIYVSIAYQNSEEGSNVDSKSYSNGYRIIDVYVTENKIMECGYKYLDYEYQKIGEPKTKNYQFEINNEKENMTNNANITNNDNMTIKENNYDKDELILNNSKDRFDLKIENTKVNIKTQKKNYPFYNNIEIVRDSIISSTISENIKINEFIDQLEEIMVLMDRYLYYLKDDDSYDNAVKIINSISKINELKFNFNEDFDNIKDIYNVMEWWLQNIYSDIQSNLVKRDICNILNSFNDEEYDNTLIKLFKDNISIIKYEQEKDNYEIKKQYLMSSISLGFILLINNNKDKITNLTKKMIIEDDNTNNLKTSVDSTLEEYKNHIKYFKGREKIISDIRKNINSKPCTLIIGDRNVGKSAIIAKSLIEDDFAYPIIIYSFKEHKNIDEIFCGLIEQCNTKIIKKIDMIDIYNLKNELDYSNKNGFIQIHINTYLQYLYEAINRVINECKEICIIFDSIESDDALINNLKSFILKIPDNCNVVLSTIDNTEFVNWINNEKLLANVFTIENFSKEELKNIFNDLDVDSLEILWKKTNGSVSKIKNLLEENNGSITKSIVSKLKKRLNINEKYDCLAEKWLDSDMMEECLLLLSVFENIQPLPLNNIQTFLSCKNIKYKMPIIRRDLKKIQDQISEIRFNRIKILDGDYAKYILDEYFSKNDIEECYEDILNWLIYDNKLDLTLVYNIIKYFLTDMDVNTNKINAYIEKFLVHQEDPKKIFYIGRNLFIKTDIQISNILKFIDRAIELNYLEALAFKGYIYMYGNKVEKDEVLSEELLIKASDMGNVNSKLILSGKYFEDEKFEFAKKMLEEASDLGSEEAKVNLALRYILGDCIEWNIEKGKNILLDLVEKDNIDALMILGKCYLNGIFVKTDIEMGKSFLKKSIDLGNQLSKFIYAKYSIENEEEKIEGINYLQELIKDNFEDAKLYYSKMLIEGENITCNIKDGIEIIEKLVERGHSKSILKYSVMLIEGLNIGQDVQEGIRLLDNEIQKNNSDAMLIKGEYFIDGEYLERNISEGLGLLERASKYNNEALIKLGLKYVHGIGIEKNFDKGLDYFKKAIYKGSAIASVSYTRVLINSKNASINTKKECIIFLEKAVKSRIPPAQVLMSEILFEGEFVDQNIAKAKELLEDAIEAMYPEAMRELGYRYLTGNGLRKDVTQAKNLLEKAIINGDVLSKTILGQAIIEKRLNETNIEYGIKLLHEAADIENNACKILGLMYIKGQYVESNVDNGKLLLMKAVEEKNVSASLELANMLIDGIYLKEDREEGRAILENLVSEGEPSAEIELANRMIEKRGVEKDYKRAINIFEKLIKENNLDAKCDYSIHLISGRNDFSKDIKTGEKLLREAEVSGHKKSKYYLAIYLIEGLIEEKNENEGMDFLNACMNADDVNAIRYYINKFWYGKEKDIAKAVELYKRLIKLNDLKGVIDYAVVLLYGNQVEKNVKYGLELLKDAVKQGSKYGKCEYAKLLIEGTIISQNIKEGINFINELIEIGYNNAKRYLAYKYVLGDKIERNIDKAIGLYEDLYKNKDTYSIIQYSELLLDGIYINKNLYKAERMLKELAEEGNEEAIQVLAERYVLGKGLKKMVKKGIHYYDRLTNSKNLVIRFKQGLMLKYKENNFKKGDLIIMEAIKDACINDLYDMGVIAYKKYNKKNDIRLSGKLFKKAYELGSSGAGVSLAYLIRRGEISQSEYELPSVEILIEKELANGIEVAIINKALMLIKDNTSDEAWLNADKLIKSLNKCTETAEWWYELAREENDVEAMLVTGWLEKYNLIYTKKNDYKKRFEYVINNEWYIPKWLMEDLDVIDINISSEQLIAYTEE